MNDRAGPIQTILVVDDETQIRRLVRNAFDGDGIPVIEGASKGSIARRPSGRR
jgi:DNA-binding NtrC family response regulator